MNAFVIIHYSFDFYNTKSHTVWMVISLICSAFIQQLTKISWNIRPYTCCSSSTHSFQVNHVIRSCDWERWQISCNIIGLGTIHLLKSIINSHRNSLSVSWFLCVLTAYTKLDILTHLKLLFSKLRVGMIAFLPSLYFTYRDPWRILCVMSQSVGKVERPRSGLQTCYWKLLQE